MKLPPNDGGHRYWLSRHLPDRFASKGGRMVFVMLNPSTADELQDDPTVRRCRGFAEREGCHELVIVNLFAVRTPYPQALTAALGGGVTPLPTLAELDAWEFALRQEPARYYVAAWGATSGRLGRHVAERVEALRLSAEESVDWHALGVTQHGHPRHPLFVSRDAQLQPWRFPEFRL